MIPVVSSAAVEDIFDTPNCGEEEILINEYSQITKAIEGRQWTRFLQLISSGCATVTDGETPLIHALCAHRPPNHVLEHILARDPSSASRRDGLLRTPLHVAIERGASSGVVRRLLSSDPSAAESKDSRGRTPLILACEEMGRMECESEEHKKLRLHRLTKAIRLMTQMSPQSSIVEDDDEITALEHAITCDAPLEIVKEKED